MAADGTLGVDFGTTHTVAALTGAAGRVQPILFDANLLLPSAVYGAADGALLVGRDAERTARLDPARYEPNPKRRVDERTVLLGEREFRVVDLVAALLRRVGDEAARVAGALPGRLVLTHPAHWAASRRAVLTEAAEVAGLPAPAMVPEPVAAAAYFSTTLGRTVPPEKLLIVYDLGGGTFDTSVLRQRPGGGWEVLASAGLDDVGGLDLDAALVGQLRGSVGGADPDRWRHLVEPGGDEVAQRRSLTFWQDVRAAKEQLSRSSSALVRVPLFETDAIVTREEFERAARPYLERTVDLTAATLQRAGGRPDQVAGVFLVGGSSRIPLVGTLLHRRLLVAPTVIEQPELVVALGSLAGASAAEPGAAGSTNAGSPHHGPAAPDTSPPPSMAPPVPPAPVRVVRHRVWRLPAVSVALVAAILVGLYGWQAWSAAGRAGDGNRPDGAGATSGQAAGPDGEQRVQVDRAVWYTGLKVTVGTVSHRPNRQPPLVVDVRLDNQSGEQYDLWRLKVFVQTGSRYVEGAVTESNPVPSGAASDYHLEFPVDRLDGPLAAAALVFGRGEEARSVLPLGTGKAVTNEPRVVLTDLRITHRDLELAFTSCDLRADFSARHRQAARGYAVVGCRFDVRYTGRGLHWFRVEHLRLKLPDGTLTSAPEPPYELMTDNVVHPGVYVGFAVKWPAPGRYVLQVVDPHDDEKASAANTRDVPFTL
ncbi:Hsp70 family protein [Phytohabitans rumicis]|uniref:Hsp70 family protein n=1 Tax=Phytohabitans rumicis TaxID=1076125 RepID=UPI0015638B5F|nr:Hsp70 family protein [Phytohabitans rumicis]